MVYSRAFTFSSGYSLGVLPCAGLCLSGLRQFQVFWASGACAVSAGSYLFASIAPLPWRGAFSQLARVVKLGVPFWRLCLTVRCSGRLRRSLNSGVRRHVRPARAGSSAGVRPCNLPVVPSAASLGVGRVAAPCRAAASVVSRRCFCVSGLARLYALLGFIVGAPCPC